MDVAGHVLQRCTESGHRPFGGGQPGGVALLEADVVALHASGFFDRGEVGRGGIGLDELIVLGRTFSSPSKLG